MFKIISLYNLLIVLYVHVAVGQLLPGGTDSVNNLVLPKEYKTSDVGAVPHFKKTGRGKQSMILIPGLGFDGTVFDDFAKANKGHYTIYIVTVPGFGKTPAPPTPTDKTSFGEQTWSKSAIAGLEKLMVRERLIKPILVGHFTLGAQLALRLAINRPDLLGGVIVLGGPAKLIVTQTGKAMDYPLSGLISFTDKFTAPQYFKRMSVSTFEAGNYSPQVYSLNKNIGEELWKMVAANPLPVMVRYLCEFHASDLKPETVQIKCPVLILRPGFTSDLLTHPEDPNSNYLKPQFIDGWESVAKNNSKIEIIDVPDSGTFLWKDQPAQTYKLINAFVKEKIGPAN